MVWGSLSSRIQKWCSSPTLLLNLSLSLKLIFRGCFFSLQSLVRCTVYWFATVEVSPSLSHRICGRGLKPEQSIVRIGGHALCWSRSLQVLVGEFWALAGSTWFACRFPDQLMKPVHHRHLIMLPVIIFTFSLLAQKLVIPGLERGHVIYNRLPTIVIWHCCLPEPGLEVRGLGVSLPFMQIIIKRNVATKPLQRSLQAYNPDSPFLYAFALCLRHILEIFFCPFS